MDFGVINCLSVGDLIGIVIIFVIILNKEIIYDKVIFGIVNYKFILGIEKVSFNFFVCVDVNKYYGVIDLKVFIKVEVFVGDNKMVIVLEEKVICVEGNKVVGYVN